MEVGFMLTQGFQLMLYGLGGVFSALALLYISVKLLIKLFPEKENVGKET